MSKRKKAKTKIEATPEEVPQVDEKAEVNERFEAHVSDLVHKSIILDEPVEEESNIVLPFPPEADTQLEDEATVEESLQEGLSDMPPTGWAMSWNPVYWYIVIFGLVVIGAMIYTVLHGKGII